MRKIITALFVPLIALFFVGAAAADASRGQGPKQRPPGWDQGKKAGWHTRVPPGLQRKRAAVYGGDSVYPRAHGKHERKDRVRVQYQPKRDKRRHQTGEHGRAPVDGMDGDAG